MDTTFSLLPVLPFRLDFTVLALQRRAKNIIDLWDNKCYECLFIIDNHPLKISVEQENKKEILISVNRKINEDSKKRIILLLEKMLGLNHNLQNFYKMTRQDSHLAPLVTQFMGLKPPRFPSVFEALCNAISCQQISLDAGCSLYWVPKKTLSDFVLKKVGFYLMNLMKFFMIYSLSVQFFIKKLLNC